MKNENDKLTFEQIIAENKVSIYRICSIYAVAPLEPADLFQEVVFHIWRSYSKYKGEAQLSTWIYRIAINVCMRYKLKLDKYNHKTSRFDGISYPASNETTSQELDEKFIAMRACIQQLKEADRSIIILHLEGLAHKEISEVTGLTENYIAVKMKRIRNSLFDCITTKIK